MSQDMDIVLRLQKSVLQYFNNNADETMKRLFTVRVNPMPRVIYFDDKQKAKEYRDSLTKNSSQGRHYFVTKGQDHKDYKGAQK